MIGFLIGLFVGTGAGIFIMALANISSKLDEIDQQMREEDKKDE